MQRTDPFYSTLTEWLGIFMRRSMNNFIRHLREHGLSMSHIGALFFIHREGGGVTELAEHLGVSNAAASQMLERLVQQELILRSEDPQDRRVKRLVLTEKGTHFMQESVHARQAWMNDLAKTLTESEKEQITEALKILIDKARRLNIPAESKV